MSKLITFSGLMLLASSAMARTEIPVPSVIPLLGIGALAVWAAYRFKK